MQPPSGLSTRLSPAGLLELLGERLARTDGAGTALLSISLSPADRLLAIGRGSTARAVLAEVGGRIQAVLRGGDRFAFASHEEVWVLLADLPSESLAELAGRKLLERLRRPIASMRSHAATDTVRLEPAIGIAWASATSRVDPLEMLSVATEVGAASRAAGGDRIQLRHVQDRRAGGTNAAQVEHDLARALDDNELMVHFQPQLDLRTGRCRSAEALIRWRHPDGRMVDPESIIEICEKRDLIVQLTRFTLNTVLRQLAGWETVGIDVSVAVNLSATTLSDTALAPMVSQALDTWDIPPSRLTLELTESALIRNQQVARETMRQLRALGCRLSIDDFGTGYSPYTYLSQFSFDELKIDQSFVRGINSDAADLRIVQSLVDLAHTFGMHAVAEGVEDEAAQATLRKLGCDLAQGWHLSAALAPDDFATWCLTRRATGAAHRAETVRS